MAMPGGFGELKAATPQIQKICDQMKAGAEKAAGHKFAHFTAVCYKEQTVAGTNYLILVNVGDLKYGHLKVFKPIQATEPLKFTAFQHPKQDPLCT
ncbi:cystatin-A-like [Paramisgurnus dabryanus]|uniref:cystatin-A n=1 Tax=Misgurnus anguillicaudatus TaxID=75329 RepID=UPI00243540D4|nr:cystatin-A-like [Misgurnus anguillicaudatus]